MYIHFTQTLFEECWMLFLHGFFLELFTPWFVEIILCFLASLQLKITRALCIYQYFVLGCLSTIDIAATGGLKPVSDPRFYEVIVQLGTLRIWNEVNYSSRSNLIMPSMLFLFNACGCFALSVIILLPGFWNAILSYMYLLVIRIMFSICKETVNYLIPFTLI